MNLSKQKKLQISYSGLSDVGVKRTENQDSYGQYPEDSLNSYTPGGLLFIVADGMGGHENGKEASRMAVRIVGEQYYTTGEKETGKSLNRVIQTANADIFQKASGSTDSYQMGTTISVLALTDDIAHIAHVGDSRIVPVWVHHMDFEHKNQHNAVDLSKWETYKYVMKRIRDEPNLIMISPSEIWYLRH